MTNDNETVWDLFRQFRKMNGGAPARYALDYARRVVARNRAFPVLADWTGDRTTFESEVDGRPVTVTIRAELATDVSHELEMLGTYTNKWAPGAVDRFHGKPNPYAREFRFFVPDWTHEGAAAETASLVSQGWARGPASAYTYGARHRLFKMAEEICGSGLGPWDVFAEVVDAETGVTLAEVCLGAGCADPWNEGGREHIRDVTEDALCEVFAETGSVVDSFRTKTTGGVS